MLTEFATSAPAVSPEIRSDVGVQALRHMSVRPAAHAAAQAALHRQPFSECRQFDDGHGEQTL